MNGAAHLGDGRVVLHISGIRNEFENAVEVISYIAKTINAVDKSSQLISDSIKLQIPATDEISCNAQQAVNVIQSV